MYFEKSVFMAFGHSIQEFLWKMTSAVRWLPSDCLALMEQHGLKEMPRLSDYFFAGFLFVSRWQCNAWLFPQKRKATFSWATHFLSNLKMSVCDHHMKGLSPQAPTPRLPRWPTGGAYHQPLTCTNPGYSYSRGVDNLAPRWRVIRL